MSLTEIFLGSNLLKYKSGVKKLTAIIFLLVTALQSQQKILSGVVVDDRNNHPIEGANILVVGTETGTVSDESGNFQLLVGTSFPVTLKITHIAYKSVERTFTDGGKYSIRLIPAVLKGAEVTITGERSAAENDVSSKVEIVSLRQVEERGIRDISEVLREMEGVYISTSTTGRQTASIRGSNANEVSVYLDGVRMNRAMDGEANLTFIDLSDLSRVEIVRGGATTLFGSGNFGGVILLHSGKLDRNYVIFSRAFGLSDPSDQDLSGAISVKGGPIAFGGRFSGKSRLYDGRTLYTSLFENYSTTYDDGNFSATPRLIRQENTIQFHSGGIRSADKMEIKQFSLTGKILGTKDWNLHWGHRNWEWDDNFFSNVDRSLRDSTMTLRLSKTSSWRNFYATIQYEEERQYFSGDQKIKDNYSTKNWTDTADLGQEDRGWAGTIRYKQINPVQDIDMIRLELGLRRSRSDYRHDQEINIYDSTTFVRRIQYQFDDQLPLNTFRLGLFAEGRLASGNRFSLFFNQGTNHRAPTLNDRFLWGVGLEKTQEYYQEIQRSRPVGPVAAANRDRELQGLKQILALMRGGLKREYVTTTELNFAIVLDQLNTEPFSSWEINVDFFRNTYLDKIAYRIIPNSLVAPFNTSTAWVNGMELSGKTFAWDNRFQLAMNMTWIFPSDALVFPDKPSRRGNIIMDYDRGIFHLNLSHIYEGPQQYVRGGLILNQDKSFSNTNVTLTLSKRIWILDLSLSYAVRNLFSQTSVVVNAGNVSPDGSFNYYDAHRQLLSFRITLAEKKAPQR